MATFNVSLQRFEICSLPSEHDLEHAPETPVSSLYAGRLPEDMWIVSAYFETANEDGFARVLATALVEQDSPDEFESHEDFTAWAARHCIKHMENLISQQVRMQMVTFDLSLDIPGNMLDGDILPMGHPDDDDAEDAEQI